MDPAMDPAMEPAAVEGDRKPKNKASLPTVIVRAKPVVVQPKPPVKAPPDLVRVRALEKGQYGLDIDIIIRNPGEVFDMATSAMRTWPLGAKETPVEGATIIETEKGQFELPGWVEYVEADEAVAPDAFVSKGHARSFHGQTLPDGSHHMDIL